MRPDPDFPPELLEAIEGEKRSKNLIQVSKSLSSPHPIVARWVSEDKRYTSLYGSVSSANTSAATKSRQLRITSSLLKACEVRGFTVKVGDYNSKQIWVCQNVDSIGFILEPWIRRQKRQMTMEERKRFSYNTSGWCFEEKDTGLLKIRFLSHPRGTLFSMHESESAPMEQILNDIVIALRKEIWKQKQWRLKREEEHRAWQEQEELRREQEVIRRLELQRTALLERESLNWEAAQRIRSYVTAVQTAAADNNILKGWVDWALKHANALDPIIAGRAGREHLAKYQSQAN